MNKPNQCIIIGGGYSLTEGLNKDLWNKLSNKFTIGTNFSYRYFDSTLLCFVDNDFYKKEFDNLSKLELIIGHCTLRDMHPNTITKPTTNKYNRDLKYGVYKNLTGIYALSLAIYLLDIGEIFMLGMDFGTIKLRPNDLVHECPKGHIVLKEITYKGNVLTSPHNILSDSEGKQLRALTHWYQDELDHTGVGQTYYYYIKNKANIDFKPFENETKCKIYNVGLDSRINLFEKISYEFFFDKLDKEVYNQKELREGIRGKLNKLI